MAGSQKPKKKPGASQTRKPQARKQSANAPRTFSDTSKIAYNPRLEEKIHKQHRYKYRRGTLRSYFKRQWRKFVNRMLKWRGLK